MKKTFQIILCVITLFLIVSCNTQYSTNSFFNEQFLSQNGIESIQKPQNEIDSRLYTDIYYANLDSADFYEYCQYIFDILSAEDSITYLGALDLLYTEEYLDSNYLGIRLTTDVSSFKSFEGTREDGVQYIQYEYIYSFGQVNDNIIPNSYSIIICYYPEQADTVGGYNHNFSFKINEISGVNTIYLID
ncbi:hypothetical protein RJI07_05965 [Mycoplasmatota bacterium WC30]